MKEGPILFNDSMVYAVLKGRKTKTRRVIKPQPAEWYWVDGRVTMKWKNAIYNPYDRDPLLAILEGSPWSIGDRLWVREAWRIEKRQLYKGVDSYLIDYRANPGCTTMLVVPTDKAAKYADDKQRYRPSIHMPRWASRITLEVTGVGIERVQDISESAAYAEGYPSINITHAPTTEWPRHWFRRLWDSIYLKRGFGWDVNPWVWAIDFAVLEKEFPHGR